MREILARKVGSKLAEALETLAFIAAEPVSATDQATGPAEGVLVYMPFRGPASGVLEMVTSYELGALLAANLVPGGDADKADRRQAEDALRELLNVTCGSWLAGAAAGGGPGFDIYLPQTVPFNSPRSWDDFIATPGASVLSADGIIVAIRARFEDASNP